MTETLKYEMKNLGWARTPTLARIRVRMPNLEYWDVPLQVVADLRDESNESDDGPSDTIGDLRSGHLGIDDILAYISEYISWEEVSAYAVPAPVPPKQMMPEDFEKGWIDEYDDGTRMIVGKP